MSATEIVAQLKCRALSPIELLDALEERIRSIDKSINALPTLCFDNAREWVRKFENNQINNSILAGLPIAIKDLTPVKGVKTTYGSLIYKDHIPDQSDLLVDHLREAGGIVYAKSNSPEFGTGGNTQNQVFGLTRNPWNTQRSVAGSSGGAAAALASGMAWLAQGSDMGGSLRNPASFCGVVGLRPSLGRVASTLSSSLFDTLSTNGPMARNVMDLALLFDAMTGHEVADPLSSPKPSESFVEAAKSPKIPQRIAFSYNLGITPVDDEVKSVITQALNQLEDQGVELVEDAPSLEGLNEIFHVLRSHNYAINFSHLLTKHEDQLSPNVVWNIKEGLKLTNSDVSKAETDRVSLTLNMQLFLNKYDAIITPSTIVPPYPAEQDHVTHCNGHQFENYYQWLAIAYAFTTTLCPAISIPCGFTKTGLPIGMQIATKCQGDALLISIAKHFEDIFDLKLGLPINPRSGQ